MKRRNFLRGAALSALTLPAWLGCAFQRGGAVDLSNPEDAIDNAVGRAFAKAQQLGKPLLVIVVPKDGAARYDRGHAWGEFLNYGDIWPLALCEVLCANEAEIAELGPVRGEPLFYLIERVDGAVNASAHDTRLPAFSPARRGGDDSADLIEARIAALEALIKDALAKDDAMCEQRAAAVLAALGEEARRFQKRSGKTTLAETDRFAAILASSPPKNLEALRLAAAERVKTKKIEGSRWTHASGCGPSVHEDATEEEREKMGMFDCGMGFVPEKSVRFLTFYTDASTT